MSGSLRLGACSLALAVLLGAALTGCSPATSSPSAATATPTATDAATATSTASGTVLATATPAPTPTATATPAPTPTPTPGPPAAPTNFTVTNNPNPAPCPISVPTDINPLCWEVDFSWQSTEGSDTWFRVFEGQTGEGDVTCKDLETSHDYQEITSTPNGARTAKQFGNGHSTGGGATCYWLVAVNLHGSSALVPAPGQE